MEADCNIGHLERDQVPYKSFATGGAICTRAAGQGEEVLGALSESLKSNLAIGQLNGNHALHDLLLLWRRSRIYAHYHAISSIPADVVPVVIEQVAAKDEPVTKAWSRSAEVQEGEVVRAFYEVDGLRICFLV